MRPRVGWRNLVSRLKQVVLPAPFGPISAWIVPRATRKATPFTATKPANSLVRSSVSRMMSLIDATALCGTLTAINARERPEPLPPLSSRPSQRVRANARPNDRLRESRDPSGLHTGGQHRILRLFARALENPLAAISLPRYHHPMRRIVRHVMVFAL